MSDGKIYIIISDRPDAGGTGGLETQQAAETEAKKQQTGWNYASHRFANFIESQAKQFMNYGINNIGNFTGDYEIQRKINEDLQLLNILGNIGTSTVAGGVSGGVPGAIIAFAVSTASTVINAGLEAKTQRVANEKINYNIEQLRKRSGLNTRLDGSRGTEN